MNFQGLLQDITCNLILMARPDTLSSGNLLHVYEPASNLRLNRFLNSGVFKCETGKF